MFQISYSCSSFFKWIISIFIFRLFLLTTWTCHWGKCLEPSPQLSYWDSGWIIGPGTIWKRSHPSNWLTFSSWLPWDHQVKSLLLWMYDYCLMPHEQALEIGNSKTSVLKYLFISWYICNHLMGKRRTKSVMKCT